MRHRKPRYARPRRSPPGSPPGLLAVDPAAAPPRLSLMRYGPAGLAEIADPAPEDLAPRPGEIVWLNVAGLGDAALLQRLAGIFGLHPLAMEDAVSHHQRPKFEDYERHHFIVLRMPDPGDARFSAEQVALCLGEGFVVTFQERPGDVFDPVRARLRNPASALRGHGADRLAHALVDAVIDAYFPVLERLGERIEALEDIVVADPGPDRIAAIHAIRHELMAIRGAIWPTRDLLSAMMRDDSDRIGAQTRVYLRDCQDHAFQLLETLETYREVAAGLVELHLSSQSNRMNEVMQVLTLIATIFIPLTFIAGVYGMNFDPDAGRFAMPELRWAWGYPVVMAAMAVIAGLLVLWFRRKGWLGRR